MRVSVFLQAVAAVALSATGVLGARARSPPSFGESTHIAAIMRLPYAGIVENLEAWYDGKNNQMRVDYYGGLDSYYFYGNQNLTLQVNPADGVKKCFATHAAPDIRQYLPDLTGFQLEDDAVQVNQQMCDSWKLVQTTLNKTSTYNFYVSRENGQPVQYQMMGYDSLIGSHFDLYQLDYVQVSTSVDFPTQVFARPNLQCNSFPGPGATHMNPLDEMDGYFPGDIEADELVSPDYAAYLSQHGKSYESAKELRVREVQYKKHSHFVVAHQRRFRVGKESYTVGLNFMADHTASELASRRGKLRTTQRSANNAAGYHQRNYFDADLPTEVDWRSKGAVAPPQDQGICGSCWSFGSTSAIEGAYFLKYGHLKVVAEQELIDCSWAFGNNGCDGGEDFRAFDWILKNGGISFKENYGPYLMQDGMCHSKTTTPDVSLHSYVNVTQFSVPALMDALASVGPISVSIDASHPGLSFYTGGVYYDDKCGNAISALDHSVSAVGYGTDPVGGDYWIIKNSWSTYWGDNGFIRMSRRDNNCGVATMPTYVVLN